MIIDIRVNVQAPEAVDLGQIRDLTVCSLSGIAHGQKEGTSLIAGADVTWRVTEDEALA